MTSVNLPDSGPQVDAIPLSYGQQQLWFLERLRGPSAAYNLTLAVRLKGTLDVIPTRSRTTSAAIRSTASKSCRRIWQACSLAQGQSSSFRPGVWCSAARR